MKLSVIIPTHNRADILELCLNKITRQEGVSFEVIVVDDGSTDHTAKVVTGFKNVIYIKQKASHQGTARNKGAKKATGDILVFIGDDILAEPGFLMQHANIHTLNPDESVVVLGYTTWDPFLEITPYMEFLESSGWQFAYHLLKPGFTDRPEPYRFFYTSNISLKKSLFDKEKFNTKFKEYGWEDIELGYRLWAKHEMRL
ncbi:MAG: glycosyltransferase family A protein, partial [Patescibacteria group bacterium]